MNHKKFIMDFVQAMSEGRKLRFNDWVEVTPREQFTCQIVLEKEFSKVAFHPGCPELEDIKHYVSDLEFRPGDMLHSVFCKKGTVTLFTNGDSLSGPVERTGWTEENGF